MREVTNNTSEGVYSHPDNNSIPFFVFNHESMFDESDIIKITLTIGLAVAMILSLFGNICTCVVIVRNRSMRTPTNCYLFNLAITDILTACFIPLEIYIIWTPGFFPLGEVGCRIHFMLWDFISNCSLLIITAFTIERYLVVSRPFLRQKLSMNSRVCRIVGGIWLVSSVFAIPDIYFSDLVEKKKYVFCYFTISYIVSVVLIIEIIVFFIIPMTLIIVLYGLIIVDLKSAKKKLRNSPVAAQQNKDRAVKMLAAVAISFFFFWSPYSILRATMVLPRFGWDQNYNVSSNWKIMNYLCYNAYLSPVANPILYSLMSRKFRQAFKGLLHRRSTPTRRRLDRTLTTSFSSSRQGGADLKNQNLIKLSSRSLENRRLV